MLATRKGMFETNSSSTHCICVAKEGKVMYPDRIIFSLETYGSIGKTELRSIDEKASFLYTGLMIFDLMSFFPIIKEWLTKKNIEIVEDASKRGMIYDEYGLKDFFYDLVGDSEKIEQYLFSPLSYVLTGSNGEEDMYISESYPHYKYSN